jgi:YD repeat-containing protein
MGSTISLRASLPVISFYLIFGILTAVPTKVHALIDTKNSNYTDTWIDFNKSNQKIQRYYNSRTVFSGMFGFGWCSDYESTIEKLPENRLKLTECGAGQQIYFSPEKFSDKSTDEVVTAIIAYYKKTTPAATSQSTDTLREQIRSNSSLRAEWAATAGIGKNELKKGAVYISDSLNVDKITIDAAGFTRSLPDGTMQKYENSGRLSHIYDKNGNFLKLTYQGDKLTEIVDNNGQKFTIATEPNTKRVVSISGPGSTKAEYKYKGEDLIQVKNMWSNTYNYEYDETHNLTRIIFPDKTFKTLTYDTKNDWVTSFTDRSENGVTCVESYKYEMDKETPKDHFWSLVLKKCGKEIVNDARFEFWYKTKSDGTRFLSRVLTKSASDSMDVTYHPEFGRPLALKRNGSTTTFDYFPTGLIKEKATANVRTEFEYKNTFNKVSRVLAGFIDPKGKVVHKRETTFTYDNKSNLWTAQNSDGQSIKLTYDSTGRIATIVDQAKKEILIGYDEKNSNKPAKITRPKLGSITFTYKPNGEINEVKSPDGPTVAVQIASTFNNLLDIIAPATSELSL